MLPDAITGVFVIGVIVFTLGRFFALVFRQMLDGFDGSRVFGLRFTLCLFSLVVFSFGLVILGLGLVVLDLG